MPEVTRREFDQFRKSVEFANPARRLIRPPELRRAAIFGPYTPASSAEPGENGQVCWDDDYIYIYTVASGWQRAALVTF